MGNWGEEWDSEIKHKEDPKGRITLNFKMIASDIDSIMDLTTNVDSKHPKNELIKEWIGALIGCFIFFLFSYKVLFAITLPFIALYIYAINRIRGAWKHFKYNTTIFVLINMVAFAALFGLALFIQTLVMG